MTKHVLTCAVVMLEINHTALAGGTFVSVTADSTDTRLLALVET